MDETIYVIFKVQFDFALEVWGKGVLTPLEILVYFDSSTQLKTKTYLKTSASFNFPPLH